MNEHELLTKKDRRALEVAARGADLASFPVLVIGNGRIAWIRRVELVDRHGRPVFSSDHWGQNHYWSMSYANRDGNGGGAGGSHTFEDAVARLERLTGRTVVEPVEQLTMF